MRGVGQIHKLKGVERQKRHWCSMISEMWTWSRSKNETKMKRWRKEKRLNQWPSGWINSRRLQLKVPVVARQHWQFFFFFLMSHTFALSMCLKKHSAQSAFIRASLQSGKRISLPLGNNLTDSRLHVPPHLLRADHLCRERFSKQTNALITAHVYHQHTAIRQHNKPNQHH